MCMMTNEDRRQAAKSLECIDVALAELRSNSGWWQHLGRERQRWFAEMATFVTQCRVELEPVARRACEQDWWRLTMH